MHMILLIDRNVHASRTTANRLAREGYPTQLVHCGGDAMAEICQFAPSLIIMDWEFRDMSGMDVLRWGRSSGLLKGVPVLMCTGSIIPAERAEQTRALGVCGWYLKAADWETMLAQVRLLLGTKVAPTPVSDFSPWRVP
jgi:DNA-binding response OmpR family regulator